MNLNARCAGSKRKGGDSHPFLLVLRHVGLSAPEQRRKLKKETEPGEKTSACRTRSEDRKERSTIVAATDQKSSPSSLIQPFVKGQRQGSERETKDHHQRVITLWNRTERDHEKPLRLRIRTHKNVSQSTLLLSSLLWGFPRCWGCPTQERRKKVVPTLKTPIHIPPTTPRLARCLSQDNCLKKVVGDSAGAAIVSGRVVRLTTQN